MHTVQGSCLSSTWAALWASVGTPREAGKDSQRFLCARICGWCCPHPVPFLHPAPCELTTSSALSYRLETIQGLLRWWGVNKGTVTRRTKGSSVYAIGG